MIGLTLHDLAASIDGELVLGADDAPDRVVGDSGTPTMGAVETDSRRVGAGSIFFALRGEATDGHLFAADAVAAGAAMLVVERRLELPVSQIVVADGSLALAALAREVVTRVRAVGQLRIIGITGSNGKTTTKNLLRAILSAAGETVAPEGSFNNHIGAPLSMLGITYSTRFLIVEMGASGVGHIARLVEIAMPDIAVVLKVGLAHAGEFGGIAETQRAKSEIVSSLPRTAVAVLNADDDRVVSMAGMTNARVRWFGLDSSADIRADEIEATITGTAFTVSLDGTDTRVHLRILGEHHVMNALAALTVAHELGIDVQSAISSLESVARAERWRMEILEPDSGVVVINDAYNASPDSMAAALKTLAQLSRGGRRSIAVLGEMAELGEYSDEEHDRIGRLIVRLNISQLIVVGHAARHIHNAAGLEGSWDGESTLVDSADDAWALLSGILQTGDIVLVKSSKSAGLRFLGDKLGGVAS